jgi:CheY-like chemotaxis protein
MRIIEAIRQRIPRGKILITENNPKNEAIIRAYLSKYRLRAFHAPDFETAQTLLTKKHLLGVLLDHEFRADPGHTGLDLLRYIRKEREDLRGFPVFVVADIETATLQEYEYLKINRYFDTSKNRVGFVIRETEPYFIERD